MKPRCRADEAQVPAEDWLVLAVEGPDVAPQPADEVAGVAVDQRGGPLLLTRVLQHGQLAARIAL